MLKRILLFIIIITVCNSARAQTDSAKVSIPLAKVSVHADSVAVPHSPVKSLTYNQYEVLMKGEDLYNMALPATLNGYPMPDEVIKYKFKLDLGPQQITKLTALAKELHRKRVEMGPIVIKNERTLDSIFKSHKADNGTIIFYAQRYGAYQGELRNAILQACFTTEELLSPAQLKLFETLEEHK